MVVKKEITKRAAQAAARISKRRRAQKAKNDPVGDLQRAKAAGGVVKPKPKPRPKPKAITNAKPSPKAGPSSAATAASKKVPEKITLPRLAGTAAAGMAVGTAALISSKNKGGSFDDAFKKARAKGEGTNFTHNGKKYTAVTKDDLKNKGYSSLAAYNKAGGAKKVTAKNVKPIVDQVNKNKKRKRPVINAVKRVLLGKDKKFGGDKGLIDFIRKPKKKADGGMMKYKDGGSVSSKKSSSRKGCGAAKRGFGKALK